MHIPILYQDADIVVIDKPAGIPTHAPDPADPYPGDALRIVQAQTGLTYLGMHQRLDADTSGVLLFAASRAANPALARTFEGRDVTKLYLAIVHGAPARPEGVVDAPIARAHGDYYRITSASDRLGQPARTRYRLVASAPGRRFSLLEVTPETGRTHQIRVHLAHIGVPVVGDLLYGPHDRPAPRLCLHAYRLTLPHPADGRPMTFTAPPPALFEQVASGLPALEFAAGGRAARRAAAPDGALGELARLAVERRAPLAEPGTTIYRVINGAGDGLPGVTADRYGEALVVSVYDEERPAQGADRAGEAEQAAPAGPAPLPRPAIETLANAAGAATVYVKYRPRQASRLSEAEIETLAPTRPALGPAAPELVAYEEGLAYLIHPGEGLSTGIFPDMREMRARVRAWAAGRRVLNCFAYTCAFGVAASAGGAGRVLNLDLSKGALERGQANYRANGLAPDPHDFVYGDVFDWLNRFGRRGEQFDLVILDPPGFSRTKTRRFNAAQDYDALAGLAARVTAPGGLLLACANVAELPWRRFRTRVLAGLAGAGRAAEGVGVYHEPALDFPPAPGHEPYLKMLLLRLA